MRSFSSKQSALKLKLHLLRQARALLEQGSFSKAAEAMNLSQSTLSKGIREFEAQVGTEIFDRTTSPLTLTDFGRLFMNQAEELLHQAEALEHLADGAQSKQTAYLRICLGPYAYETLAPRVIPGFVARHPDIRLQVDSIDPVRASELLRAQAADLVICESSVLQAAETLTLLPPLQGCVLVRKGHPLESTADISMAAVSAYPSVQVTMLPPRILKSVLTSKQSVRTKRQSARTTGAPIITSSVQLALDIVQSTDAYMFATLGIARTRLEQGLLVPVLQEPWMHANWAIAHLAASSPQDSLLEFCEDISKAHQALLDEEQMLSRLWPMQGSALRS